MLLAIDVGNTNTVLALMEGQEVVRSFRVTTQDRTTDETGLLLINLLRLRGIDPAGVTGAIVASVVPSVVYSVTKACRRYLSLEPLVVGTGIRTGVRVRVDNPKEVGADRIVNAVAALERWAAPLLVVDFGTATTFDCVNSEGEYVGGAIAPGLQISADALFTRTSKLPRVEVTRPKRVIGTSTVSSIQAGLFHGYVGLVQELVTRTRAELHPENPARVTVIATGGLSNLIGRECPGVDHVDDALTMRGLSVLFARNGGSAAGAR